MNLEKFTERSRGFLQAAQTIAMRESHQRLAPEHLLKALMDDEQGLAVEPDPPGRRRARAGASRRSMRRWPSMPKVTGDAGQVYMDSQIVKVLDEAEKLAKKAGDSFVPVERILTALAIVKSKAQEALDAGRGDARRALNAAINDIRKGRTADTRERRGRL